MYLRRWIVKCILLEKERRNEQKNALSFFTVIKLIELGGMETHSKICRNQRRNTAHNSSVHLGLRQSTKNIIWCLTPQDGIRQTSPKVPRRKNWERPGTMETLLYAHCDGFLISSLTISSIIILVVKLGQSMTTDSKFSAIFYLKWSTTPLRQCGFRQCLPFCFK